MQTWIHKIICIHVWGVTEPLAPIEGPGLRTWMTAVPTFSLEVKGWRQVRSVPVTAVAPPDLFLYLNCFFRSLNLPYSCQSLTFRKSFSASAICRPHSNLSVLLFWSLIVYSKDACLRIPVSAHGPIACMTRLWATPFITFAGGSFQNKPCRKLPNRHVVWNEICVEWMHQSFTPFPSSLNLAHSAPSIWSALSPRLPSKFPFMFWTSAQNLQRSSLSPIFYHSCLPPPSWFCG